MEKELRTKDELLVMLEILINEQGKYFFHNRSLLIERKIDKIEKELAERFPDKPEYQPMR